MYSVVLLVAMSSGGEVADFGRRGGCNGCYGACYGGGHGCRGGGLFGGHRHGCRGGGYSGCYGGYGYSSCYGGYGGYSGCYGGSGYGGYSSCYGGYSGSAGCYGGSGYGGYSSCYGGYGGYSGSTGCYGGYGGYSGGYACGGGVITSGYAGGYAGGYACGGGVILGGHSHGGVISGCTGGVVMPPAGTGGTDADKGKGKPPEGGDDTGDVAAPATLVVNLPADATLTINGQRTTSTSSRRVFLSPALKPGKVYRYSLTAEVNRGGNPVSWSRDVTVRAGAESNVTLTVPAASVASR
jgi:uncharacterized protein (TIGR03000 family)